MRFSGPITRLKFQQLVLCNFLIGFAILLTFLSFWLANRPSWQSGVSCQVVGYQKNCTLVPLDTKTEESCQIRPIARVGHLLSDGRIQFDICDPKIPIPFSDLFTKTFTGSHAEYRVDVLMQVKWPIGHQSTCWVRNDCGELAWIRTDEQEMALNVVFIAIIVLVVCLVGYMLGTVGTMLYYCWKRDADKDPTVHT